jgi:hypothetical protein
MLLSLSSCSSADKSTTKEADVNTSSINSQSSDLKTELQQDNVRLRKENAELKKDNLFLKGEVTDLNARIKELETKLGEKAQTEPVKMLLKQELQEDLDGNGELENLKLECDEYSNTFRLSINNLSIAGNGNNIRGLIEIIDLNKSDKTKEVAIPEIGPSDDYYTHFYRFDRNSIDYLGTLGGNIEGPFGQRTIILNGDGTLTATRRGSILHTWFYKTNYKYTSDYSLVEVKPSNSLYSMGNYKVKVIKSIPIYKANKKDKLRDLKVGEEVLLKYSDDRDVVILETSKKELGYIMFEGFSKLKGTQINTSEVFEGLCMAD